MNRLACWQASAAGLAVAASLWSGQAAPPQDAQDAGLARLAAEMARGGEPAPIPLESHAGAPYGVVYDRFRLMWLAARSASAAAAPAEPAPVGAKLVIVAYALGDRDRMNAPQDIQVFHPGRQPAARLDQRCGAREPDALLPGVTLPPLTCAATFQTANLGPDDVVEITYADPLTSGGSRTAALPVAVAMPRKTHHVEPVMPPGEPAPNTPIVVRISALIDVNGAVRFPYVVSGPDVFGRTALSTVEQWRFEPARVNGAPIPVTSTFTLTYQAKPRQD
jgi:Gram-negative bacterial TonB protein C-terminal